MALHFKSTVGAALEVPYQIGVTHVPGLCRNLAPSIPPPVSSAQGKCHFSFTSGNDGDKMGKLQRILRRLRDFSALPRLTARRAKAGGDETSQTTIAKIGTAIPYFPKVPFETSHLSFGNANIASYFNRIGDFFS